MRMATPFGGGLARWGTVCGAVVGGAMCLGFRYGRKTAKEKEKREITYEKVQKMLKGFEKSFGSLQCADLIHLHLRNVKDRQRYQDMKMHRQCARFVARIVKDVHRLLQEK